MVEIAIQNRCFRLYWFAADMESYRRGGSNSKMLEVFCSAISGIKSESEKEAKESK